MDLLNLNENSRKVLMEAIRSRHSIRNYLDRPLEPEVVKNLRTKIDELNQAGKLHIQLVTNEPKGFSGFFAYGQFSGVKNYIVMAGKKSEDLDSRIGYYGELLVLYAQSIGLYTCWAGLSYRKVPGTYTLADGEKIACYISLGYGANDGRKHKIKTVEQVSNASPDTPGWFLEGVKAALLAPTAVNQQKFYFEYAGQSPQGKGSVIAKTGKSIFGYTQMDLGIAKCHFEIGAGKENFVWVRD